jgi:hypothetical protein
MTSPERPEAWWRLDHAPSPQPGEAPSSWVARIAHAHHLLVDEMVEVHACTLPALDRGRAQDSWSQIVSRTPTRNAPAPSKVFLELTNRGLFNGPVPHWGLADWWCYCPTCIQADLRTGRPPFIRSDWLHPLAFACVEHEVRLRAWPHGLERLLPDGAAKFELESLGASDDIWLTTGQLEIARSLRTFKDPRWAQLVHCVLALVAGLALRSGRNHDGPAILKLLTPADRTSSVKGAKDFRAETAGEVDTAARLELLTLATSLVAHSAADTMSPLVQAELQRLLLAGGRYRPRLRPSASRDPLFIVLANLNERAGDAMARDLDRWPDNLQVRMRAAVFVDTMARLA